ncbi:MAG: hypothetical protein LAO79_04015 [Acidobacteriia bacterium]|nr:hypothetical protein [Terriglobia bacterium]
MKNRLMMLFALLAMSCMVVLGADVSGKWASEGGKQTQTFTFKQSGSSLTGTVEGGRGGSVEIKNGKVDGDNVSFDIEREFQGNSMTIKYSGTVSGDTMKLTVDMGRGPRDITLKKQ